jgi:hypothetical protein
LIWCDAWQRIQQTRRHELEAAYRQTLYAVPSMGLILEIDKPSQKLLQLADSHPFDSWAFFTACNPRSELLTEAENNTRMQELAASLTEAGYTYHHAVGTSMDGHWSEPSYFVPGMDAATAVSIGNHWEQMAVVASLPILVKLYQHAGRAIPR